MKSRIFLYVAIVIAAFFAFQNHMVSAAGTLDISQVQIAVPALVDVANWTQTTTITATDTGNGGANLEFDKKSPNTGWPEQYSTPDNPMPGIGAGDGINHTVWIFRNVGGQWYGAGVLQALGDYNDPIGSLANLPCGGFYNVPQMNPGQDFHVGEQIAFMVTAGSERGSIVTSIKERSNIVVYTIAADNLINRDPACGDGGNNGSGDTGPIYGPSEDTLVPPPVPVSPVIITGVDPLVAKPNDEIVVTGAALANHIQLISSNVIPIDITTGTLDTNGTYVTFTVPAQTPDGEYLVKVIAPKGSAYSQQNLHIQSVKPIPASTNISPPTSGLPTDLGQLIGALFIWSLSVMGLVVFTRFFYAGFKWAFLSRGNSAQISEAKAMMTNATLGAVFLFSAYIILNTINPNLVSNTLNLPGLPASAPATSTTTNNTTSSTVTHLCGGDATQPFVCTNSGKGCATEEDCGGTSVKSATKLCINFVCTNSGLGCAIESDCGGN